MEECRLRGNTFLLLLLRSCCPELSSITGWGATSNGITKPNMFLSLLQMIEPNHHPKNSTLAQYFSQYMDGSRASSAAVYPFDAPTFRAKFKMRMENEYPDLLNEMDAFCHKFLDINSDLSMRQLVAGLVVAICHDKTISREEKFNCGFAEITRAESKDQTEYILQPFLLSVWYYLVQKKYDVKEAQETYKKWTGEANTNSAPPITTEIGFKHAERISVTTDLTACAGTLTEEPAFSEFQSDDPENVETEIVEDEPQRESNPQQVRQTVNNWYNAPGGIQAEHIENLVLPEDWGNRHGK